MRCHRGFWAYAGDKGTDISDSAARFAQEQASQAEPGTNKAAENWLRTRAGRALKKRWEGETAEIRQDYILKNPDATFSLDDNPLGFADGRQDRRRYPRMVRADIATPVVLQEEAPAAPATTSTPVDTQCRHEVDEFKKYQDELLRAASVAEVTALAHAVRANDVSRVVSRSVAVVECMGAQIAARLSPDSRAGVVGIIRDVTAYMQAARTQLTMHSDEEADGALHETQTSAAAANSALGNYVRDTVQVNPVFKAMHEGRETYATRSTNNLQELYWLGKVPSVRTLQASSGSPAVSSDAPTTSTTVCQAGASFERLNGPVADGAANCSNDTQISPSAQAKPTTTISRKRPRLLEEKQRLATANSKSHATSGKEQPAGNAADDEDSAYEPSNAEDSDVNDDDVDPPNRFFRKRVSKNDPLIVWTDLEDEDHPRTVHVYPVDLDSLQAGAWLTQTALDYFICRYMERVKGLLRVCGSELYVLMETARFTRKPKRRRRLLADLVALFDWSSYQYVLLPVSGRNHYSFLVIENAMHPGPTKVYHVNSMKNAHSSAYAFDVLQWVLSETHKSRAESSAPFKWNTSVHLTKPQQSNGTDCGVYVLHYMDVISKHIQPRSLDRSRRKSARGQRVISVSRRQQHTEISCIGLYLQSD